MSKRQALRAPSQFLLNMTPVCVVECVPSMMRFVNFLSGAALIFTTLQSADAARHDPSSVRTILMLGDSLTDGYGLPRSQAYPALIAEKIRAQELGKFDIINAGVSGDTTAGGLRRIGKHLDRRIDIFVLALGINDAFRGVPMARCATTCKPSSIG